MSGWLASLLVPAGFLASAGGPTTSPTDSSAGTAVPATYQAACAHEGTAACNSSAPPGEIPQALRGPLRLERLRPGQRCPVARGYVLTHNRLLDGAAFGNGPVGVVVANSGEPRDGIVDLAQSDVAGWLAFKTIWFSRPSYQGPFSIRALRLDGPGSVALQDGARTFPVVVPPGPTSNSSGGWRSVPDGTYVKGPGCYGFEVDTTESSELIVVHAVGSKESTSQR